MKKFITLLLFFVFICSLAGCQSKPKAPKVSLSGMTIEWNAIENAQSYYIYLDEQLEAKTSELSYTFELTDGTYSVFVKSFDGVNYSNKSNTINLVVSNNNINTTESTINIFEINDTHGSFNTDSTTSGIDKVSTVMNKFDSDTLVKVANGDIFQGGYVSNMTRGKCFIDALNFLEFDCFVIGNHEFDWGLDEVAKYKDGDISNGEAEFPFLGANIINKTTNSRPDWIEPYTIVEVSKKKVGIIGIMGDGLESSIAYNTVKDYQFTSSVESVKKYAKVLRTEEACDLVIVATHGYEQTVNTSYGQLSGDQRVDGILCAHTHQSIDETVTRNDGYKIPVIQSKANNKEVGVLTYTLANNEIVNAKVTHLIPASYQADTALKPIIAKYQSYIDAGNEVIGYTSEYMSKSTLGALACDSMIASENADIAFINTAGVRAYISAGNILAQNLLAAFPFENSLVSFEMDGATLISFLEKNDKYFYFNSSYLFSTIESGNTYKVVTIDFVFTSSYYKDFLDNVDGNFTGKVMRDVLVDYIKTNGTN